MLKITINTGMLPIIDVGMYRTNLDVDEVNTDMDYNDYVKELEKIAQVFIHYQVETPEVPSLKIVGKELKSPKYYNYTNDTLELEIEVDENVLYTLAEANKQEFNDFLKEQYKSYPGFVSFMPKNYKEWLESMKYDVERGVTAILHFMLQDKFEYWQQDFENKVHTLIV